MVLTKLLGLTLTLSTFFSTSPQFSACFKDLCVQYCNLFYLGFLSQTFTVHRTAGEGGGYFFNCSLPTSTHFLFIETTTVWNNGDVDTMYSFNKNSNFISRSADLDMIFQ